MNAYIQFTAENTNKEYTHVSIAGELNSNANPFEKSARNISSRIKTKHQVDWLPKPWTKIDAAGQAEATPDLKEIVQEIVNLNNWQFSNSMAFVLSGSGKRTAHGFNKSPYKTAILNVSYVVKGEYELPDD